MRNTLWIIPVLLLSAAIGASNARADEFIPTFTCTTVTPCGSVPTALDVSFPAPTTLTITDFGKSFTTSLSMASDLPTDTWSWFLLENDPSGFTFFLSDVTTGDSTAGVRVSVARSFPIHVDEGSLTFTAIAAPEPDTAILMLTGIGLVFVMPKRLAQGHRQAT